MNILQSTPFLKVIIRDGRMPPSYESVAEVDDGMKYTEESVNFLYRMTFWWLNWLMKLGFKRPIEIEDVGTLPEHHKAFHLYSCLKEDIRNKQVSSIGFTY